MARENQLDRKTELLSSREALSSTEKPLSYLAASLDRKRVIGFLKELANFPRPEDSSQRAQSARQRAVRLFPEFSPNSFLDLDAPVFPVELCMPLRQAWEKPVIREREGWLFSAAAAALHHTWYRTDLEGIEKWSRIAAAIFSVVKFSDRLVVCGSPECDTPYFIAVKKNQRYCSEKCAGWAKRLSKKEWWDKNKGKRRKRGK